MSTIAIYQMLKQISNMFQMQDKKAIALPEHKAIFLGEFDQILDKIDLRLVILIPILRFQWIVVFVKNFFKRKKKGTVHRVKAGPVHFHFTVNEPKVTVTRGASSPKDCL